MDSSSSQMTAMIHGSTSNRSPDCDSRHQIEMQSLSVIGDDYVLSITDQESAGLVDCEQQHVVNIDTTSIPLPDTTTFGDHLIHSPALRKDISHHSSPVDSQEGSTNEHGKNIGASSYRHSDDILSLRTSLDASSGGVDEADRHLGFALESLNQVLEPMAGYAWPDIMQQPFAGESDLATVSTAAEDASQCLDLAILDSASTGWQHNIWIDVETQNILTVHYFEHICQIMSCFDSRQNPFRKDIPPIMLNCGYMNDCVNGLSAAHLANSIRGMDSIALKHQTNALRGLLSDIQMIEYPDRQTKTNKSLSRVSAVYARHDALLAALLLGISTVRSKPEPWV